MDQTKRDTIELKGDWDHLRVEKHPSRQTAVIVLDRPEKYNIFSFISRSHLNDIFQILDADPDVRVIIIRGEGGNFSSGGNIQQFLECHPEELSELRKNVGAPERSPKPVIAQLQGYAFGVGLEIALACDFRIAADNTILALPELNLGMIPGSGGTQRVARLAGLTRAKDMIMRARRIGAQEAYQWGLLTEVVPLAELDQSVRNLADELLRFSPMTMKVCKEVLNASLEAPLSLGMEIEGRAYGMLRGTEDFAEGVKAFAEKRKPNFKGR